MTRRHGYWVRCGVLIKILSELRDSKQREINENDSVISNSKYQSRRLKLCNNKFNKLRLTVLIMNGFRNDLMHTLEREMIMSPTYTQLYVKLNKSYN